MLSVEERHALVLAAEEALHTAKAAAAPARVPEHQRLDATLRSAIAAETAQRHFYELLNRLTRWSDHPAVAEPRP